MNDQCLAFKSLLEERPHPGIATSNAWAVRQLLAEDPDCRACFSALGWNDHRLGRLLLLPADIETENGAEPWGNPEIDYGSAFAKAEWSLEAFLTPGRPAPFDSHELVNKLHALSREERFERVAMDRRFSEPDVVKLLLERSHNLRYEDPASMLEWAELARMGANSCTAEAAGNEARLFDLKARTWGHLGNSLRVGGQLREAEETLAVAQKFALSGTGDPLIRARIYEQLASLHIHQRRFDQAIRLAGEAGRIYRELGETQLLALSLVNRATAHLYSGDPRTAVGILNRAIPMIDGEEDPHLLLAACHNLVRCFIDLEMPEQALSLYHDTRRLYEEFEDTLVQLKITWQEGHLLRDLGRLENAETALLRARTGFVERGLAYEVALVSLDLAAVYAKLGFVEEVRQTITEALPTFRALQVDRETIASLLQLQQVADQEAQALSLIRMISARLEQFPGRFRPYR